jgi:hypothetical protein
LQEKYGFVYIWYDRKRKMYYIGSHWGTETDGYVCSSNRMRDAYRRRPDDFKRRILSRVYTNRSDLFQKEQDWFDRVKCRDRYYNLNWIVRCACPWELPNFGMKDKRHSEETRRKISNANIGRKLTNKTKEKISLSKMGDKNPMKGKKFDPISKEKMASALRKMYYFVSPDGIKIKVENLKEFCEINSLSYSKMGSLYNGTYGRETYKGWRKDAV